MPGSTNVVSAGYLHPDLNLEMGRRKLALLCITISTASRTGSSTLTLIRWSPIRYRCLSNGFWIQALQSE